MKRSLIYIGVIIVLLFTLFPFIWMVSTSFKPAGEVYAYPPRIIPNEPSVAGYKNILFSNGQSNFSFLRWAWNSFVVSLLTTIFSMIIALPGGYALSRYSFKGKQTIGYIILISQVLPGSVMIIPFYFLMGKLHLLNTLFGLALAYITFAVPFCTWMIKGFFNAIPSTLDESAIVEGCNMFQVFSRVILPLTIPGIAVTSVFSFITGWNEYIFASVFMKSYSKWTLSLGISSFQGQYTTDWSTIMAGSVFIALPIVFLFLVLQKYLISGMTAGAVKQ
ncbi:carbohydrate ABC transporter permease [Sediminispirochaeta bajacaliforniensis]|uniref:carbohydrate ABC transporter permease n=1 Tax=Sediminispirochaeta bajacaliforniensis TaxID=148 RepID=UPI000368D69A|nr:carbohydrate ABC transporter permease [Sediminispirochaeta bajacaliforniensis]